MFPTLLKNSQRFLKIARDYSSLWNSSLILTRWEQQEFILSSSSMQEKTKKTNVIGWWSEWQAALLSEKTSASSQNACKNTCLELKILREVWYKKSKSPFIHKCRRRRMRGLFSLVFRGVVNSFSSISQDIWVVWNKHDLLEIREKLVQTSKRKITWLLLWGTNALLIHNQTDLRCRGLI